MDYVSLEKWAKIRLALDIVVAGILEYKNKVMGLDEALSQIRSGVAELFGENMASKVVQIVKNSLLDDEETAKTITRVQKLLKEHEFGEVEQS